MGDAANATRGLPAVRRPKPGPIRYAHSGVGPAGERTRPAEPSRTAAGSRPAEPVLLAERVLRAGSTRLAERIALAGLNCPPEIAHE